MSAGDLTLTLAGERLQLLPEGAVFWRGSGWLLVADTHFGKGAAFRRAGLAVPVGSTADTLARLSALADRTGAHRVMILGDVLHAALAASDPLPRQLAAWREQHPSLRLAAVRGNHDRTPQALAGLIDWHREVFQASTLVLRHHPQPDPYGPVLAGHLHPVVRISGPARDSARLPAFILEGDVLTLPAFGALTGGHPVSPAPGRQRFVATPEGVVALDRASGQRRAGPARR